MRKKPSKEELEFYYWVLGYSTWKIAEIFRVSQMTVQYWMRKYGIPRRPQDLAVSIARTAISALKLEEIAESIQRRPEILEIIDGLILSDACIEKTGRFVLEIIEDHADWIYWLRDQFELVGFRCSITRRVGKIGKPRIRLRIAHPLFKIERERWYPHGRKIVPEDVRLTPLSLSQLYMGDGLFQISKSYPRIVLCTLGFTKEENEFLAERIRELYGFHFGLKRFKRKDKVYYGLQLSRKREVLDFLELTRPWMIPSFSYKWRALFETV